MHILFIFPGGRVRNVEIFIDASARQMLPKHNTIKSLMVSVTYGVNIRDPFYWNAQLRLMHGWVTTQIVFNMDCNYSSML